MPLSTLEVIKSIQATWLGAVRNGQVEFIRWIVEEEFNCKI